MRNWNIIFCPGLKKNFVSAMFYLSADSLYKCKLNLRKDQIVTDTTLTLNYNSIRNTSVQSAVLRKHKERLQ